MTRKPASDLRRGWTTGACATAATKAALMQLWGDGFPRDVTITLPRGETPTFAIAHHTSGAGWAEVGITKDAGDDPDVTHGALVIARVSASDGGIVFKAGEGVGTVTKPGLPIPPGEPAINPVPRQMITTVIKDLAGQHDQPANITVKVSIPGGADIALKTWNPRLGIKGGLSILGTTGIVRPFSCSAWIASIHRGIDVARADGLTHVAGCTGATSEKAVQDFYHLPDHAMLDMGDFAGGMLKYLARHPIDHITIGGGIGKIAKLAQGAVDLHSSRSQVDLSLLADEISDPRIAGAETALHALQIAGEPLAINVADRARKRVLDLLKGNVTSVDIILVDRNGNIITRASE